MGGWRGKSLFKIFFVKALKLLSSSDRSPLPLAETFFPSKEIELKCVLAGVVASRKE